ncbi:uncharacterized protein Asalp_23230 [Aeromonas salmonicida subsp. pectinolytica 34mel]|uniref:Uncharacterized protein n=1 Tax=Aeromonas salmonicida subsp. pectinolytica 34mel TaxID=1324960 RepID=A0A2D1QGD7_AERSA|nr:uncharacterized protein Asalp_23230 [Aeromonas salmonicida subsp. pectinolytica 34mel]
MIVAKRLINHVGLENNLTVMAIKAVLVILCILVMSRRFVAERWLDVALARSWR